MAESVLATPAEVASYALEARLDAERHSIAGAGRIRWRNTTAHPASELRFHLYLNAFRNSASSFLRREGAEEIRTLAREGWGSIELSRLTAPGGADLLAALELIAPEDGNPDDATVARVPLPSPVPPGGQIELEVAFVSQLPRVVERTGFKDDFHFVAQWFPKLGVFEQDGTWTCPQFRYNTEFFADFGRYDVTLDIPGDFVVGATGVRLSREPAGAGRERHRYVQADVHDFAWTAWPDFVDLERTFRHPGLPEVRIRLLLRPETRGFADRYFKALENGLRWFGEWYGPYPYPTLTMVDPPWGAGAAGGMEYPTFIATGTRVLNPLLSGSPEAVTIHELGHQWFYGLLASDEFRESFLDEGLTTWATGRVQNRAYPPQVWTYRAWELPLPFRSVRQERPLDTSARYFRQATQDPIARTAWGYLAPPSYRALTYSKMSLLMEQVERTVGTPAMERAMRVYAERFRWRHPRTADLVSTLSNETGHDLFPLFAQTVGGSDLLDYAVEKVSSSPRRTMEGVTGVGAERRTVTAEPVPGIWDSEVLVRRLGGVQVPVTVELRFASGVTERRTWDGRERWVRYRIEGPELSAAVADPDAAQVLDADRLNNSRRTEPDRRASRRWAQRLRFWVQNLLETFAELA
ncbi:MAG TPA: M1 family metallopeptidase [Thermoanaerobaculia bacterium]|nr:M1 family metallopeptidase [Thermoanaerobaculia bacterium]